MQKSPEQEEAEPDEGKPARDTDSLGSLSNKSKLSPALPSLLLDYVQDSESSSPQLRRILLTNKESRAAAQWSGPEAVWPVQMRVASWQDSRGGIAHFKYQEWPQAPQTPSSTVL